MLTFSNIISILWVLDLSSQSHLFTHFFKTSSCSQGFRHTRILCRKCEIVRAISHLSYKTQAPSAIRISLRSKSLFDSKRSDKYLPRIEFIFLYFLIYYLFLQIEYLKLHLNSFNNIKNSRCRRNCFLIYVEIYIWNLSFRSSKINRNVKIRKIRKKFSVRKYLLSLRIPKPSSSAHKRQPIC